MTRLTGQMSSTLRNWYYSNCDRKSSNSQYLTGLSCYITNDNKDKTMVHKYSGIPHRHKETFCLRFLQQRFQINRYIKNFVVLLSPRSTVWIEKIRNFYHFNSLFNGKYLLDRVLLFIKDIRVYRYNSEIL